MEKKQVVAHLKPQNLLFRQICNALFHHYSASSILLRTFIFAVFITEIRCLQHFLTYRGTVTSR